MNKSQILIEQSRVFRIATDPSRYGLTLKAIGMDASIDYGSLCNYARGLTEMPLSVLTRLCGVIPNELLSLLLPESFAIVRHADEIDHNELARIMLGYLAEKAAAHRPESEAGPAIGPGEDGRLTAKAVQLRAVGA